MQANRLGSLVLILSLLPAAPVWPRAEDQGRRAPAPARSPTPIPGRTPPPSAPEAAPPSVDLEVLLRHLGERARAYEALALRLGCIQSARSTDNPRDEWAYDYMYVQS